MAPKRDRKKAPDHPDTSAMAAGTGNPMSGADEQSGDLQGLSDTPGANSQSVRELAGEGQSFEAEVIRGVEDSPPADVAEVTTHQVPEDDVPLEYLEQDEPKE